MEIQSEKVLQASLEAFKAWRSLSPEYRAKKILSLKSKLELHKKALAKLITQEMHKPITESLAEVSKSHSLCDYVGAHTVEHVKPLTIRTDFAKSYICAQPLGPILGIMPWNFPIWQTVRFALPALAMGNTVIIKPAKNVFGTADLIQAIFEEAGLGSGVFQTVKISAEEAGLLIDHVAIKGVSLTGSVKAGRDIGARAGRALKPCVLELGGSDPYIILKDADLDHAAKACVQGRFVNTGQSCVAAKRFIVIESVHDSFIEKLGKEIQSLIIGDPFDSKTQIGPLARKDLLEELEKQIDASVAKGATIKLGGRRVQREGNYYEPTLLINVKPGQPVFDEETFGPVAVVIKARDEEDAIRLANGNEFGLGAAIFSKDAERAEALIRDYVDSGLGYVNDSVK